MEAGDNNIPIMNNLMGFEKLWQVSEAIWYFTFIIIIDMNLYKKAKKITPTSSKCGKKIR